MCAYEKLQRRNIAERKKKFEEFKLANLVSDASAHLKKKKSITKADNVGTDDAFQCNALPTTSRSLPKRSCNQKISYYEGITPSDDVDIISNDELKIDANLSKAIEISRDDSEDENMVEQDLDESLENQTSSRSSSPDIDYEALAKIEQNYEHENDTENLIESTKNCTEHENQENVEEIPLENPICILLDQRSGQKRPVGITELRNVMKDANFQWNFTRLPIPSDYEYDPGCDYGSY